VLHQHFLPGPEDEAALVARLDEELRSCALLVTFNGRAFDVPLLHTRFIMQGRALPIPSAGHLDLMGPARRLWRHRLRSCALVSLEQHVLGLQREGDVPGREIPGLYLEYLRTGDAAPLAPVMRHNAQDVLSMAALAMRIRALLDDHHPDPPDHPAVWLGLGGCHEHLGAPDRAEQAYLQAREHGISGPRGVRDEAARRLSRLYKRQRRWDRAEHLWRDLIQQAHPHGVYPYEELAKHLEHHAHQYEAALEAVDVALLHLATGRLSCRRDATTVTASLQHRQQRLRRLRGRC
jgi:tetratricopeptide (TPR) repeat protein